MGALLVELSRVRAMQLAACDDVMLVSVHVKLG